ncbi:MAG: PQQ-binding-like beta-propeller repeat protein, partial [Pirellulales bacterium]
PPVSTIEAADVSSIKATPEVDVANTGWPWWRGTQRNGHAVADVDVQPKQLMENVLWKSPVPGRGHATPIIYGNQVFVATADKEQETQSLRCYNRSNGDLLWNTEIHQGGFPSIHSKNSFASGTPACDGEQVFCCFANDRALWMTAVDFDGKVKWRKRVGDLDSQHGFGGSPVIYKSLVIIAADHRGPGYLAALDRADGDVVWRKPRPQEDSYGCPVVAHVAGRDQLLLSGQHRITSYDPASGQPLWNCKGIARVSANTTSWYEDLVIGSSGYPDNVVMCVRADGSGDVTDSHVLWTMKYRLYVPSALVVGDKLVLIRDDGVAMTLDPRTGKTLSEKRLGGAFSASPTLAGETIYVPSEQGDLLVLKASDPIKVLAKHKFGEGIFASPVVCDRQLFIRGEHHLYCIGKATSVSARTSP